jgi:pyrimidine-nucleoside phosphorylase
MIRSSLEARRDGREQSPQELQDFIAGVVSGEVTRAQAAAWLAFTFHTGMTDAETVALTLAMRDSGEVLSWPSDGGLLIDKHSTGGVGDKVSLVLAPLWASLGMRVPMLSGRGLGITGGTLDKLESIPGFDTGLSLSELKNTMAEVGCFMNGQTAELAPADRILYALRDETCTVPSIPFITASILSKKLAEGISNLVMDVKCGNGAFMQTKEEAQALSESLVRVGNSAGLQTEAHITDMSQPLGLAVGNALEVEEAVACLQGGGPSDLRELVLKLSPDAESAAQGLDSGTAHEKWLELVSAHHGDPGAPLLGGGCARLDIKSEEKGEIVACHAGNIGQAAFSLGAGRIKAGDPVHHGVGVLLRAKRGDTVQAGQVLATIVYDEERDCHEKASAIVAASYKIA